MARQRRHALRNACRIRRSNIRATRSSRSRPARSAVPTCISTTASSQSMKNGDVLGHETMGEVVEVGAENKGLKVGDRVVVPFTISCGECFFCKRGFFSGCERSNPNHEEGRETVGPFPRRPVRLLAPAGWLRRRPGGISPRSLRRCRADQGAGRPDRRAGAVPVGHFPDRLHGGRLLQYPGRRHDRDLGLRSGRPVRHPQRLPAGCRTGHRDRYGPGAADACPAGRCA